MSISKEQIETRKSQLEKDFQTVKQQIEDFSTCRLQRSK